MISKRLKLTFIVFIFELTSGCSSAFKSTGLGGAIGAGTGASIGGIVDPNANGKLRTRNVIIGAAAGGIIGSFAGAAIHENNEKEKELSFLKGKESKNVNPSHSSPPQIQQPKVDSVWVESRIMGNRYVEGHYEYIITEPTRWEIPQ